MRPLWRALRSPGGPQERVLGHAGRILILGCALLVLTGLAAAFYAAEREVEVPVPGGTVSLTGVALAVCALCSLVVLYILVLAACRLRAMRNTLAIERRLAAAPSEVYSAWTDPRKLRAWAWGSLGKEVTGEADVRVGGRYRLETAGPEGGRLAFRGTYLEVAPQERLVYTVDWDPPMPYPSTGERVAVEFRPDAGGTAVTFLHSGLPEGKPREEHRKGWENCFDILEQLLAQGG